MHLLNIFFIFKGGKKITFPDRIDPYYSNDCCYEGSISVSCQYVPFATS